MGGQSLLTLQSQQQRFVLHRRATPQVRLLALEVRVLDYCWLMHHPVCIFVVACIKILVEFQHDLQVRVIEVLLLYKRILYQILMMPWLPKLCSRWSERAS